MLLRQLTTTTTTTTTARQCKRTCNHQPLSPCVLQTLKYLHYICPFQQNYPYTNLEHVLHTLCAQFAFVLHSFCALVNHILHMCKMCAIRKILGTCTKGNICNMCAVCAHSSRYAQNNAQFEHIKQKEVYNTCCAQAVTHPSTGYNVAYSDRMRTGAFNVVWS